MRYVSVHTDINKSSVADSRISLAFPFARPVFLHFVSFARAFYAIVTTASTHLQHPWPYLSSVFRIKSALRACIRE